MSENKVSLLFYQAERGEGGEIKDPVVQWVYAMESCYLPSPCLLLFPSDA